MNSQNTESIKSKDNKETFDHNTKLIIGFILASLIVYFIFFRNQDYNEKQLTIFSDYNLPSSSNISSITSSIGTIDTVGK